MPSNRLLRILIVTEVGFVILSVVASLLAEPTLPEPLRSFLEAEAEADISRRDVVILAIAIPLIVMLIVSWIGLFFIWRPARTLYALTLIGGLLITPFVGPYIDAGWGTAFESVAMIISGVILALIFLSPMKELFDRPNVVLAPPALQSDGGPAAA